ncbi:unnamed protein product [Linum trigynum]|uniref:Protein BIG GRAIN 1-like E n=1 Tax=Linum trigynum TaxID=586398 RepID=A0AAV2FAB1_9ROSI
MSVTGLSSSSSSSKLFHKPIHHRTNSDELDIFEAAKYFSGYNEPTTHYYITSKNRASLGRAPSGTRRMSLEMPMENMNSKKLQIVKENNFVSSNTKPHKQPNSPVGKLSNFLSTLFHQAAGGSKKKPPNSDGGGESPCGGEARKKRRSSISYFTRSFADTKSWYSTTSSKSGFRTPPPLYTPTKAGFRTVVCGGNQKPVFGGDSSWSWLDENLAKLSNDGLLLSACEKSKVGGGSKFFGGDDGDDGGESDSSSDLFELQNYDLDACPSGLPVYETTDVGSITSGNGTI